MWRGGLSAAAAAAAAADGAVAATGPTSWYRTWSYGDDPGEQKLVPEGYRVPSKYNVFAAWTLWYFGDRSIGVRPHRLLSPEAHLHPDDHTHVSKIKQVVLALPVPAAPQHMQRPEHVTAFQAAYAALCTRLYGATVPARAHNLSCGRLYELMRVAGMFKKPVGPAAAAGLGLLAEAAAGGAP